MDWLALVGNADTGYHDSNELKKDLSILFVLESNGHRSDEVGGKYVASCPFPGHQDSNPSFDVFGENLERWGCYPCNVGGDVLDLIQKLHPELLKFVHAKDKAAEYLSAQRTSGWTGPTQGRKRVFDQAEANRIVLASSDDVPIDWVDVYEDLTVEKSNPGLARVPQEWIRETFRISTHHGAAIIPYFDRDMNLVAYKRRKAGEKIMAASGSDFSETLYGEWLDTDPSKKVLLCEGESDVWAAMGTLAGKYAVLGLSTGAGSYPTQASTLTGRDVVLAFDGDQTGRRALVQWVTALQLADVKSVRIVVMPDRMDLATSPDIEALVAQSQPVLAIPRVLAPKADGIYKIPKTEDAAAVAITNWVFAPKRQLLGTDGDAWEGTLLPHGIDVVISSADMSSKSSLVKWASKHGGSWFGSDNEAQHLQASLQAVRPFLATGNTSTVAGLHDNHFIYPGGSIGPDYWVYDAGVGGIEMERYTTGIVDGDSGFVEQLLAIRDLHRHDIMDPIIAWLAVAPLRSLISPFPTLAVLGGSGTGKTTLLETVLRQMTGTEISVNLTSTTAHAIHTFAGSTNSFPVWFDEYRPGAGQKAIEVIDQIVRDAYNGHGSAKGGMGGHWSEVRTLRADAPLIVSGEDAFTETSHVERIVPVYLTPSGRSAEALALVQSFGVNGWAKTWLETLHWGLITGHIPALTISPEGAGLQPRMQHNLGVLRYGWNLLQFYAQMRNRTIPDPDFSGVVKAWDSEQGANPIMDALNWIVSESEAANTVKIEDDFLYVRVTNFVAYVNRAKTYTLPGGQKAVGRYMVDHLGGQRVRSSFMGTQAQCIAIPVSTLDTE